MKKIDARKNTRTHRRLGYVQEGSEIRLRPGRPLRGERDAPQRHQPGCLHRETVLPADETPTHIVEPLEDYLRQAAERDMGEIEKLGEQKGVGTKTMIRYGHPVEEIVREAETKRPTS